MAEGFLRHFEACNRHDLSRYVPFAIDGNVYGHVSKELAALLPHELKDFTVHKDGIALTAEHRDFASRSAALGGATTFLSRHFDKPLRREMYPILRNWGDEPLAELDRSGVPWFGVRGFGIHVNGFVRKPDGIHLWIGERAMDRPAEPGKLDNLIGGGQPIGLTLEQNLAKEAKEEAGIEPDLAAQARPVSTLRYICERGSPEKGGGLRNDTLFVYDLELPEDFMPQNTDGEVAAFHLMPAAEAAAIVRTTDRFKFNCNLVVIDFLLRHGLLTEDKEYNKINNLIKNMKAED